MRVPGSQRRIHRIAQRAVQLDRGVHHLVHHIGEINLGDAVLVAQVEAFLRLVSDMHDHQPCDVELAGAFGEHELHALAFRQGLAEGRALGDVPDREVERALRHRDVVHAVAQAAIGEAVLAHVETVAFAAQEIFRRHFEIGDVDLGMTAAEDVAERAFRRHGLDVALDLVAGVGQLDEECRELLMPGRVGIGLGHDQRDVGDAGGGREPLLAVQHVSGVALFLRAGLHAGRVGARRLLGHRVADALLAVQQGFKEFLLLIVGAVLQQRQHGRVVGTLRVHRQSAEIALAQLHLHQRVGERAKAHAAIFLRNEGAPQALRPRLLAQFAQDRLVVAAVDQLLLRRHAFVMHPFAHFFADRFGFRRNLEVDGHVCSLF